MSFVDAASRISQIQAQLSALNAPGPLPSTASATRGTDQPAAATFSETLARAQTASASSTPTAAQPVAAPAASVPGESSLTQGQRQFASRLAADTGLDAGVISAWLLAEESAGAAKGRERAANHNWLNIGYTDSRTYGASDAIWSDPTTAADATAGWLRGQETVADYGAANAGIRAILATAGQPPEVQIAAIRRSGWASSGYPSLPGLYRQLARLSP